MKTPAQILNSISANKGKDSNQIIMERTKGTLTGSVIGLGVGLIYAFRSKKSYLIFGTLGILAGGFISNMFINKEINKKKEQKN